LKILVVDDDTQVLSALKRKLEDLGHDVEAAPNAFSVIVALDGEARFDLVVTDYSMPGGMNGCELAEAIRTCGFKMPIWLFSASDINEKMTKDAGIERVFSKRNPQIFFEAIEKIRKEGE